MSYSLNQHPHYRLALVSAWCAVAFTVVLPRAVHLNSVSIMLLSAVWLAGGGWAWRWQQWRQQPVAWLFLALFLLHIVVGLFTVPIDALVKEVERKLAFLALPLVAATCPLQPSERDEALKAYVLALLLVAVCSLGGVYVLNREEVGVYYWVGNSLVYFLALHRVYLAMHLLAAVVLLLARPQLLGGWRWAVVPLFLLHMGLLASRNTLLAAAALAVGMGVLLLLRPGAARWQAVATLGAVVLAGLALWHNPKTGEFWQKLLNPPQQVALHAIDETDGVNIRKVIWSNSLTLLRERGLWGIGPGQAIHQLRHRFRQQGFSLGYLPGREGTTPQFNTHNQLLQTNLELGLAGGLVLLGLYLWPLWWAWQRQHWSALGFGLVAGLASLTECILEAQKGIVWYAVLACLLYIAPLETKYEQKERRE